MFAAASQSQLFIQNENGRQNVASLQPYLRCSFELGNYMEPGQMRETDREGCRWINYGLSKGVTNADINEPITVFSTYSECVSTMHGLLIQGFDGVDEYPWCYHAESAEEHGFGGFIRWAYLASPDGTTDVLAVDYQPGASPKIGKAGSLAGVMKVAKACLKQGISANTELVLANQRMCEDKEHYTLRMELGLVSVANWARCA